MSKTCLKCATDVIAWIEKFASRNRVYLDKLYFEENKVSYQEDDRGTYISGEKFAEIERAKAEGRCPRCGSKELNIDDEDVQWGPV